MAVFHSEWVHGPIALIAHTVTSKNLKDSFLLNLLFSRWQSIGNS